MHLRILTFLLACVLAFAVDGTVNSGQAAVADFYKDKKVTVIAGLRASSTYSAYARVLSRHMGQYIPGKPGFIVQNMPGAGSLKAYNHIYNIAARDGTVFGTGHRFVPIMPLFKIRGARFDGRFAVALPEPDRPLTVEAAGAVDIASLELVAADPSTPRPRPRGSRSSSCRVIRPLPHPASSTVAAPASSRRATTSRAHSSCGSASRS